MKASNPYRQELRSRIVEAATQMFHKHGIKMVKMDDIATSLTISKRTLYEIYDNKEDLVYEVVVQHAVNTGHKVEKLTSPGSNGCSHKLSEDANRRAGHYQSLFLP